jgi:myo-inositol-1(or 4)-monophosphatase
MKVLRPVVPAAAPKGQSRPIPPGLLTRALEVAGRLANDAAEVITATAGAGLRPAGAGPKDHPFDWVTDTDRTLERHTRRVLAAEFPQIPVVGEEYGGDPGAAGAPYRWVVDPVDGTANYVAGLPWYAYSLALVDADGPVVGVLADPSRAQIYAAARGRGVRANGVPVRAAQGGGASGSLVCTELVGGRPWPGMASFLASCGDARTGVRILGSTALSIAQVALGHAVAAVLDTYEEWDVAGALTLALEAGAVVVDRDGRPDPMPPDGLLVAVPGALSEVLGWWRAACRERPRPNRPAAHG